MRDGRLSDIEGGNCLLPCLHVKLDYGLLLREITLDSRVVLITCT